MSDENGQLQPVTRMKGRNIAKKVNWEKVYTKQDEEK
jgi:hypothetical protein